MICKICNNEIEPERLEILPNTICCAPCAHKHNFVKPRKGIMVFDNKTGGELQTMSAEYFENNRHYFMPIGAQSAMSSVFKSEERE
jgi:RNA polymerase-binding transcription factor DksA